MFIYSFFQNILYSITLLFQACVTSFFSSVEFLDHVSGMERTRVSAGLNFNIRKLRNDVEEFG